MPIRAPSYRLRSAERPSPPGQGLEAPLPGANVAATPLWLESPRTSTRSEGPGVRKNGGAPSLLRFVDPNIPPLELVTVQFLDSPCGSRLLGEFDEGESSRATGIAVGRQEYSHHLARFREKSFQLALGRIEAQVTHEHFGANDGLLSRKWLIAPHPKVAYHGPADITTGLTISYAS